MWKKKSNRNNQENSQQLKIRIATSTPSENKTDSEFILISTLWATDKLSEIQIAQVQILATAFIDWR